MICQLDANNYCAKHQDHHLGRLRELSQMDNELGESYRLLWDQQAGLVKKKPVIAEKEFDRVYLVNLERRAERKEAALAQLESCPWDVHLFVGIDGSKLPCPSGWRSGQGAWGCMQSHRQIIEQALLDNVQHLLVLEDDIVFCTDFMNRLNRFLEKVPADFDGLMLGGEHQKPPQHITKGIVRVTNASRTHAYSLRGEYMKDIYKTLHSKKALVHCDWLMGNEHYGHKVYAPDPWLVGQGSSHSDISGRFEKGVRFWK